MAQGSNVARDRAKAPLFTYVNEDKLKSIKTYECEYESGLYRFSLLCLFGTTAINQFNEVTPFYSDFISLLDNYEMSTGVSETVTSEELKENKLFIDAIVETDVMKVQWIHRRA